MSDSEKTIQILQDDIKKLRWDLGMYHMVYKSALGELDAAKKDAARYQWLRDYCRATETGGPIVMHGTYLDYPLIGDALDAAIDARMELEKP